jgi:phosphinothricin acetyltransferase
MQEPSFVLRDAAPGDLTAIQAIYAPEVLHGSASFETEAPDLAEMRRRYDTLTGGRYPYLVAADDSGVLGYAYAGPYRTRPAYRFTVENSIYVAQRARGRGVGRALLARLIAECEARGFRQMVAVIGDSANLPSIRLHAALGFAEVGVIANVGWKHGRWLDSVLMQRALGPGADTPAG